MFKRKKPQSPCEQQRQVVEAMSGANLARHRPSIVENPAVWVVHATVSHFVQKAHGRIAQNICEAKARQE